MSRPNFAFFSHRTCEYFPCHPDVAPENFNCLFCYCPLYALDNRCGGRFAYSPEGVKDCSRCDLPHRRENYEMIIQRLTLVNKTVKRQKGSR